MSGIPTNRSNISLPTDVSQEIIAKMQEGSAVMSLAEKNELDKQKVDEAVANLDVNRDPVEMVEEVNNDPNRKQEKEDEEFLNSLGL